MPCSSPAAAVLRCIIVMGALHLLLWLLLCCGAAGAATIVGAGSNVAAQVYADARFAYRFANPAVEVQFYPSESHMGHCCVIRHVGDVAPCLCAQS